MKSKTELWITVHKMLCRLYNWGYIENEEWEKYLLSEDPSFIPKLKGERIN